MEITMDYETTKGFVEVLGWDEFIKLMNIGHTEGFYECTKEWIRDESFGCTLQGEKGDLIINWRQ